MRRRPKPPAEGDDVLPERLAHYNPDDWPGGGDCPGLRAEVFLQARTQWHLGHPDAPEGPPLRDLPFCPEHQL